MAKKHLVLCCFSGASLILALTPGLAQAQDFSGPYVGAQAGIGILDTKGSTIAGPFDDTSTSAVASAVLGYRTPLGEDGPLVLGIEGDVGIYSKGSDARYGVSGLVGFRVGDNGMAYARGGYAWRDGIRTGVGKGIDGPVYGGGFEFGLSEQLSFRIDYKYLDYDDVNVPDNIANFSGHEVTGGVLLTF